MPVTLSSPVYLLTCSVCQTECFGKKQWLSHLTQNDHQKLARQEFLEKWDSKLRKCSLVVFTSGPLTSDTAGEIVKYFSTQFSRGNSIVMVTDFIWWDDRPQIGILQFESRAKAKDVIKASGCPNSTSKIRIDDSQWVQVKRGVDLLELEWQAIMPPMDKDPTFQDSRKRNSESVLLDDQVNPKEPIDNQPVTNTNSESMEPELDVLASNQPLKKLKLDEKFQLTGPGSSLIQPMSVLNSDKPPPSSLTPATHPLQFQFWSIRKAMLIPDLQYQLAMEAVASLKSFLSRLSSRLEVSIVGNWYLKLKYPQEGDLQVYIHKPFDRKPAALYIELKKFLNQQENNMSNTFRILKEKPKHGFKLMHLPSNVNIVIVTPNKKGCLMEVQVCRLIEYLCQFDPRCHSLITLVCYWINLNSIKIAGESDPQNPLELPPHYTVYWLVLFYMIHAGYIPSPREILNKNPAQSLKDSKGRPIIGADIRFCCDPVYVKQWRSKQVLQRGTIPDDEFSDEYILDLFRLFRYFLQFCEDNFVDRMSLLIFDTRDGLLATNNTSCNVISPCGDPLMRKNWINYMTTEDITDLKEAIGKFSVGDKGGFYMTHPFFFSHNLPFTEDINIFLNIVKKFRGNISNVRFKGSLKNFGSLENVLRIK